MLLLHPVILAILAVLTLGSGEAMSADYASVISAYRKANGQTAVKSDRALEAVALKQVQAMSASGQVTHTVGGLFNVRIAPLRRTRAAENIGAGFLSFADMFRQWQDSRGHRDNLLMPGARRVGVASVANPRSPYRRFWAMVITD